MTKSFASEPLYEFKEFRLDVTRRILLRDGKLVALAPKALETLLVLVENSGRVVEKSELIKRVWPDSFVEEINLTVHISSLRKVLGETPDEHHYIVTVPRRGYTFVAPVVKVPPESQSIPPADSVNFTEPAAAVMNNEVSSNPPNESIEMPILAGSEADKEQIKPDIALSKNSHSRVMISVAIGVFIFLCAFVAILFFSASKSEPISLTAKSIAVLPFKSIGSESEASFELSLADALITKLTKLKQINVKPTSAIFTYRDPNTDPIAAGRDLGVDTVMQGTVQKVGEQVRLTIQMIRVTDGKPVWANHFDARGTDPFALQDSLSEQVAQELNQQLTTSE